MSKTAVAVAVPADHYENPFKALVDSVVNMGELIFDFMYGTPQRSRITYFFAIGFTVLGFGLGHASGMPALRDCPVTSL